MTLEDLLDELAQFSPACEVCVRMDIPFDGVDRRDILDVDMEVVDGYPKVFILAAQPKVKA